MVSRPAQIDACCALVLASPKLALDLVLASPKLALDLAFVARLVFGFGQVRRVGRVHGDADPVRGKPRRSGRGRVARTACCPTMFLPLKPKAAYGGTRRKSRLWRDEQPLGNRPRNPPKRLRGGSMPRLSAVGISGLQAGEDVNRKADKHR